VQGVRVLELGTLIAGPFTGRLLRPRAPVTVDVAILGLRSTGLVLEGSAGEMRRAARPGGSERFARGAG
jgi:hypothetical protein